MQQDTAVELGNPKLESLSLTLWTDDLSDRQFDNISVLGPPLCECEGLSTPFGQIVILGIEPPENIDELQLFRNLEAIKYGVDLKGYMRRGVSQFLREWSRVSHDAMKGGFSFHILGQELYRLFKQVDYVKTIEIIFITDLNTLLNLKPAALRTMKIIEAMNKMLTEEMSDCDTCDYSDICSEVTDLKKLRDQIKTKESSNL